MMVVYVGIICGDTKLCIIGEEAYRGGAWVWDLLRDSLLRGRSVVPPSNWHWNEETWHQCRSDHAGSRQDLACTLDPGDGDEQRYLKSFHCNVQQSSRAVSEASISWQLIGDGRIQKTFTPVQVANNGDHRDYANQYDCQDSTICNDTYQLIGRHRAPQRKSLRMICSDIWPGRRDLEERHTVHTRGEKINCGILYFL